MPESLVCRVSVANALGPYTETEAVRIMETAGRIMRAERDGVEQSRLRGEHRPTASVFPPSRHNSSTIEPKSAAIEVESALSLPPGYGLATDQGHEGQGQSHKRRSEDRREHKDRGYGTRWSADSGRISTPGVFHRGAPAVVVTPSSNSVHKRLTEPFQRAKRVHAAN